MPTEFLLFMLFQNLVLLASSAEPVIVKNPDCQPQCGNISIPYPFGVGERCSIDRLAVLICNTTFNPPKLFFAYLHKDYDNDNLEIVQLSQTQVRVRNSVSNTCHNAAGYLSAFIGSSHNLYNTPYTFSEQNKFTVIGCGAIGVIQEIQETSNRSSSGGCVSLCYEYGSVVDGSCSGSGCCQTSIPNGLSGYVAYVDAFNVSKAFNAFNVSNAFNKSTHGLLLPDNCFRAFMADNYTFNRSDIYSLRHTTMMLDFAIGNQTCEVARLYTEAFVCKENSDCYDPKGRTGYICNCTEGYEGNPYLGCHEIKKVRLEKNNLPSTQLTIGLEIGLSFGMGLLLLLVVASCIYFSRKKRKILRIREMFFQQNGGLLLKQHISSCEGGGSESIKIFTADDLELATNNYDERRILGQGGFGTVFRGILPDLSIVAIKKSKVVDASQLGQFINEVIILTQINHRNIVKLLGCCLETEVPLLVYEFVSNGTLSHHICKKGGASSSSSSSSSISWENRLRIAAETAGALAYLHSAASIPIIHRDVKSSNILLDENYTAKVADFGASRLNPLDQTQISTLVKG